MATYLITHEVDDVDAWMASPKRKEAFGTIGVKVREFVDPAGSNRIGLIAEIPDLAAFQAFMSSPEAAAAMKHDGVRPETLLILREG
ncbi:hypothetical protein SAMN05421812_117188 [Asanoa hainanensis]|uniref:DUF1330 domain-containing protein n=1 Tax=Asanoa hainanensis TaxID=560556 RepID=A0A239PC89_9ACTN|nr:hypothetical protein [Asanoa hainanensis]SNT64677.1 hypothetical protein SAMN05421812_117188 [Asanoa hainanensis]